MDTPSNSQEVTSSKRYGLFAVIVLGALAVVVAIALVTRTQIESNEREWFVARLNALIPTSLHDNDLYADRISVSAPDLLGSDMPISIFRARRGAQPTGAILTARAADGYGGPIDLLVAVDYDGVLLGVDVVHHSETQGIGDGFERHRSNWLDSLVGKSLSNPTGVRWTIRKDGGDFDQFTGASITPRAILKSVRRTLEYYVARRDGIFNAPSAPSP